ncbi:MAG: hypothetical protein ACRDOS_09555 [Gaiellaceae bacterium]
MRKSRMLLATVVLTATLAVGTGSAGADGTSVVASASGGSVFDIHDMFGFELIEVQPFTFTAQVRADGSVSGKYLYRTVDDGVPFLARGPLTCAVIEGNRAWLGGVIEKSSDSSIEGLEMWFQVADNGEPGADESPDMTTLIGAGGPGTAQDYCDRAPEPMFPFFLEHGNIQVRSS